MVDSLGDNGHSRFLTPKMVRQQEDFGQSQLEGIGIEVEAKDGHVVICGANRGLPCPESRPLFREI